MKGYIKYLILFLAINFGGLGLGSWLMNNGPQSFWYMGLEKAPWTPPGWVFGFAWTFIMICFSIYLAYLWHTTENKTLLIGLFVIQWLLNVGWNPTFFYYNHIALGLVIISALTILIGFFLLNYWPELKFKSLLILPYFLWLLIATSLNGYALLNN